MGKIKTTALLLVCILTGTILSACDRTGRFPTPTPTTTLTATDISVTPTPTPDKAIEPADSINLLISDWIGWKPIIDANGGLTTHADSIYRNTFDIDVAITVEPAHEQSTASLTEALASGAYNAIGCTVNQYAAIYPALLSMGISAKAIYAPATSCGWDYLISSDETHIFSEELQPVIAARYGSNALFLALSYFSKVRPDVFDDVLNSLLLFDTDEAAAQAFESGLATWLAWDKDHTTSPSGTLAYTTTQKPEAVIGIIVVTDAVLASNNLSDGFVRGALNAVTQYIDDSTYITMLPTYAGVSEAVLTDALQSVIFADAKYVMDILYNKNYAEDAFNKAVRFNDLQSKTSIGGTIRWEDAYYTGAVPPYPTPSPTPSVNDGEVVETKIIEVQFKPDSPEFVDKTQVQADMATIVAEIKELTGYGINIKGYVSKVSGTLTESDKQLAQKRADAIKDYLISEGVDSTRITAQVGGALYSDTDEYNPAYRKVEIEFIGRKR